MLEVTNKTVTYELFDISVVVFLIGGCAVAYAEEQSVSAIVETLTSVTLRGYAEAHDLTFYVRPIGGMWKEVEIKWIPKKLNKAFSWFGENRA